jgi:hypothetical protein
MNEERQEAVTVRRGCRDEAMKLSELIEFLQKILQERGDLLVTDWLMADGSHQSIKDSLDKLSTTKK